MNAVTEQFLTGADSRVLRLITAGSVDDGKSTLIGRLLLDSKGVFADQIAAISRAKHQRVAAGEIDLALLTDGLEAEREQGITIDVAYRYFATPRRKFILADAPGHEQYTRNMVTGASTADAAVILIDPTRVSDGQLLIQTRRHSTIAHLLGIRHIVVAINKMDLVGWDEAVYTSIRTAYQRLAAQIGIEAFHVLPVSALKGDNVVRPSAHTPWYAGPPLLELLESLEPGDAAADLPLRVPVQWVSRHDGDRAQDFRGYAARLASGRLRVDDEVVVQPAGARARVAQLSVGSEPRAEAIAGDSVMIVLDRDVDVSRGDVFTHGGPQDAPRRDFDADLCWLDTVALAPARQYLLKHGTRTTPARIHEVRTRRDLLELKEVGNEGGTLALNDIGRVALRTRDPLVADPYAANAATGAFILIDPATHQTVAAGMIRA